MYLCFKVTWLIHLSIKALNTAAKTFNLYVVYFFGTNLIITFSAESKNRFSNNDALLLVSSKTLNALMSLLTSIVDWNVFPKRFDFLGDIVWHRFRVIASLGVIVVSVTSVIGAIVSLRHGDTYGYELAPLVLPTSCVLYLFLSTWCFWSAAEGQRPRNYLSCCCCSCFSLPHLLIYHSLYFLSTLFPSPSQSLPFTPLLCVFTLSVSLCLFLSVSSSLLNTCLCPIAAKL